MRQAGTWEPLGARRRGDLSWLWPWLVALAIIGLLILGIYFSFQYRLETCPAIVSGLLQGRVLVRTHAGGPWELVDEGALVPVEASIRSDEGTVARIVFCDGSLMRIESAGQWQLLESARSRNGRIAHVSVAQHRGKASFVSRPPQPDVDDWLRIELPGAVRVLLAGACTIETLDEEVAHLVILQGGGRLHTDEGATDLQPGQQATVEMGRLVGGE